MNDSAGGTPSAPCELTQLPLWRTAAWIERTQRILDSFERWVGRPLMAREGSPAEQAEALYFAPRVVVAHGTEPDPIFQYGNQAALDLWELDLPTLLRTPSRTTAEPMHAADRQRLLDRTAAAGFCDEYSGVRITSRGRRFRIRRAIVWNLVDADGRGVGQAATFSEWDWLDESQEEGLAP